ncbi:hypothetical protein B0H19DRAFT_1066555 [Mycena capillaripes]|nr:hypothetical protein B0H19DRAFT_1066555 [Mycena capillaripes]
MPDIIQTRMHLDKAGHLPHEYRSVNYEIFTHLNASSSRKPAQELPEAKPEDAFEYLPVKLRETERNLTTWRLDFRVHGHAHSESKFQYRPRGPEKRTYLNKSKKRSAAKSWVDTVVEGRDKDQDIRKAVWQPVPAGPLRPRQARKQLDKITELAFSSELGTVTELRESRVGRVKGLVFTKTQKKFGGNLSVHTISGKNNLNPNVKTDECGVRDWLKRIRFALHGKNIPPRITYVIAGNRFRMATRNAFGNLLAAVISLKLVPEVAPAWRALFWTASGISVFGAFLRSLLPESETFLKARRASEAHGTVSEAHKTRVFIRETNAMLKKHWMLCIYAVLLLTGFNFLAHGSQDLYPTYVQENKGLSTHASVVATIIGNCGAITGGAVAGWASQFLGRRINIVLCEILTGAFIPLWILPKGFTALAAALGSILSPLLWLSGRPYAMLSSHVNFDILCRSPMALLLSLRPEIGNMIASAAAQIEFEATSGDHLKTVVNGKVVPDYGKVQGILTGAVAAFVILITIIGPAENHSSHFEKHRVAFDERGAGDIAFIDNDKGVLSDSGRPDGEKSSEERVSAEKPQIAAA